MLLELILICAISITACFLKCYLAGTFVLFFVGFFFKCLLLFPLGNILF